MSKKCDQCGQDVEKKDVYCTNCGGLLKQNEKNNEEVGKQLTSSKSGIHDPLSLGDFMFIGLIIMLPVVNAVVFLIWALDKHGNINRRNLAKAGLIYFGIGLALSVILGIGMVRAIMLDQQNYPDRKNYNYQIEHPDFDDWVELPFYTEET